MRDKIFSYERKVCGNVFYMAFGLQNDVKLSICKNLIIHVLKLITTGFMFYLNSIYIHSRLFSVLCFILGFYLLFGLKEFSEIKINTKEEFLNKIKELLKDAE